MGREVPELRSGRSFFHTGGGVAGKRWPPPRRGRCLATCWRYARAPPPTSWGPQGRLLPISLFAGRPAAPTRRFGGPRFPATPPSAWARGTSAREAATSLPSSGRGRHPRGTSALWLAADYVGGTGARSTRHLRSLAGSGLRRRDGGAIHFFCGSQLTADVELEIVARGALGVVRYDERYATQSHGGDAPSFACGTRRSVRWAGNGLPVARSAPSAWRLFEPTDGGRGPGAWALRRSTSGRDGQVAGVRALIPDRGRRARRRQPRPFGTRPSQAGAPSHAPAASLPRPESRGQRRCARARRHRGEMPIAHAARESGACASGSRSRRRCAGAPARQVMPLSHRHRHRIGIGIGKVGRRCRDCSPVKLEECR